MTEQKTVMGLIDDVIDRWGGDMLRERMGQIRTAVKQEQEFFDKKIRDMEESSYHQSRSIEKKNARLKYATWEYGDLLAMYDARNKTIKQLNEKIEDLTAQLKSVITMRPISELPDKVPDGCSIIQLNGDGCIWEATGTDTPKMDKDATHFCIIPLPSAERKLHPCYMPGCNGAGKIGDIAGDYRVKCELCGATGPRQSTEQLAMDAWGYQK